jgi:hypothetical protein
VLGLNILVPVGTAITLIPFFQWDIVSAYVLFTIALTVRPPIVPNLQCVRADRRLLPN